MPANLSCIGRCLWLAIGFLLFLLQSTCDCVSVAATTVVRWDFDSEASMPLRLQGDVQRDQAGPRPPEFPDFADDNTALKFDGKGYLTLNDPGPDSEFDFTGGDSITLEAWVRIDQARDGEQMYLVSKGRTNSPGNVPDNQNWALRAVSLGGIVRASFLFATPRRPADSQNRPARDSHWHRWISTQGFAAGTGWHHLAVAYQFGTPESMRAWIDGVPTTGAWDMGGPTVEDPVVDDDAIWIGSSQGGNSGNSFRGYLDGVAIHREILSDQVVASRFHRIGGPRRIGPQPEVMPELAEIPQGRVLVSLYEGMPAHDRWLNEGESWPEETQRWLGDEFLLPRIPIRFGNTGMRESWASPLLLRMAGDIELPAGKHRVLLRVRSQSRLWIDGKLVARTNKNPRRTGNEEPVVPIPPPLVPGARLLPFPQQEVFVDYVVESDPASPKKTARVVLEVVVGGKNLRTQTGETLVAIQPDSSGSLFVMRPDSSSPLMLSDQAVVPVLAKIDDAMRQLERATRREATASQDDFWNQRHQLARRFVAEHSVPTAESNASIEGHPIDRFLEAKVRDAIERTNHYPPQTATFFHEEVLPILQTQCFRCHGEKQQGGLRLNTRAAALGQGESGEFAVVPGDLDASELILRVRGGDMPPTDDGLNDDEIATLEKWVAEGAVWPMPPLNPTQTTPATIVDDASFLRRTSLDILGVGPTLEEAREFLNSDDPNRRQRWIDYLLDNDRFDERFADHWVSFWLDLLAENPTLLNPSLNSTGPFRWFLHDALRDRTPVDRMVTDLIMMRGSAHEGGSAGFALAGENDSPMAAKAHILASAFLGIELQCARCHDSPFHATTQEDLYSLAAMLNRKPITPPKTSRVPDEFFDHLGRPSLIRVTLKPDTSVNGKWPFASVTGVENDQTIDALMSNPEDPRERLAALITAPSNERFSQVIVNHLWTRLIGEGIVSSVHDWEGDSPSHPELLRWLAEQWVSHDYDIRHVLKLILTSHVYQRAAIGTNRSTPADQRFFVAPDPRRLSAEQIVDSLFQASGREMDCEELTFVHDGTHPNHRRLSLGTPTRAWMFAGLNNERDRPSLSLPRAQSIVDVLEAFGWTGTRQQPIFSRDTDPNVLQPGILAGGTLTHSLSRAADQSRLADLAVHAVSPDELLENLFLSFLSRYPSEQECETLGAALAEGFEQRKTTPAEIKSVTIEPPLPQSTWTNHLLPEANEIQQQWQERVRRGPPHDPRLGRQWREVYEDVVWSLINHREFVWVP